MHHIGTVDECFEHIDEGIDFIISQEGLVEQRVIAFRLGGLAQYTSLLATYFMTHDRPELSKRAQEQYERVISLTERTIGLQILEPEEGNGNE